MEALPRNDEAGHLADPHKVVDLPLAGALIVTSQATRRMNVHKNRLGDPPTGPPIKWGDQGRDPHVDQIPPMDHMVGIPGTTLTRVVLVAEVRAVFLEVHPGMTVDPVALVRDQDLMDGEVRHLIEVIEKIVRHIVVNAGPPHHIVVSVEIHHLIGVTGTN